MSHAKRSTIFNSTNPDFWQEVSAMPLRDHFHSPLADRRSWDELHGAWPAMIVMALNKSLPPNYVAAPQIHLGGHYQVAAASFNGKRPHASASVSGEGEGGVATAVWAPPQPTLDVAIDLPDPDEYEVRVYEEDKHERRLVAAVEIVSPSNKDQPENRRLFVAKCAELLRRQVSVTLVDLVTARQANLYGELLKFIGQSDPSLATTPPPTYAAACRWRQVGVPPREPRLETWAHRLAIGQPLPTLPLWLSENLAIPLELEASYEETCRVLRIA
jgi:hypothetical protein